MGPFGTAGRPDRRSSGGRVGKGSTAGTDRIVDRATDRVVGYDSFTGRFDRKAETPRLHAAFSLRGGILLAQVHTIGQVPKFRGTITGGTGVYEGATGTVRGHGGKGDRTFLTITWSKRGA